MEKSHPRVRLRMARETAGWSQEELGKRLGSGQVTVSRWEVGETTPSPYFREKLCRLFKKAPQELDLGSASMPGAGSTLSDPLIPPLPQTALLGREWEVALLKERLCASGPETVIAVHGLPGVGKTTLAVTLAHAPDMRALFPDGVLWVGLGSSPDADVIGHR